MTDYGLEVNLLKCLRCGEETLEPCELSSSPDEWSYVKYDKDGDVHHFDINIFVCSQCGHLEFIAESKPKFIVTKDLELLASKD